MSAEATSRAEARRELAGKGSVYTLATALQAGVALLVLPLVTRLLDPSEFGTVAVVTIALQLVGLAVTLGLPSAITLEHLTGGADGPERAGRLVTATVVVAVGLAAVVSLAGLVAAVDGVDRPLWTVAAWGIVPVAVLAAVQAQLRAAGRPGRFVAATGLIALGGPLAGLAVVALGHDSAVGYLAGLVVAGLMGAVAALALASPGRPGFGADLLRPALAVGLPLVPHAVALYALLAADRLVIEHVLGPGAAGRYQVAYLVGSAGVSLLTAVNNAWAPLVLGTGEEERWPLLAGTTADLERVVVAVVAATALLAPFALRIAAPTSYDTTTLVGVVAVVGASALPVCWYLAAGHVLLARRRTVLLGWTTPLVAALSLAVLWVVLPDGGLVAAALVTVAAYGALALLVRRRADALALVPWDRRGHGLAAVGVVAAVVVGVALPATGAAALLRLVVLAAGAVVVLPRLRPTS